MKYMKKLITIMSMLVLLLMPVATKAQIYIMDDEEESNSLREGTSDFWFEGGVPYQGGDQDEFLPLADGILLLAGLAGSYYLLKKRKEED